MNFLPLWGNEPQFLWYLASSHYTELCPFPAVSSILNADVLPFRRLKFYTSSTHCELQASRAVQFSGETIFLVSLCRLLCYAHFLFSHALKYGSYFTFFLTKLINARRHYTEISWTEFCSDRSINTGNRAKINFPSKVRLLLDRSSGNSRLLNKLL